MNRYSFIALLIFVLASCSESRMRTDGSDAIRLTVDVPETRASLFEGNASLFDKDVGGRSFMAYSYMAGDGINGGKTYIDAAEVEYFEAADDWRFIDASGNYINYYWPKNGKLNFFAHMPAVKSEAAVTEVGYSHGDGSYFLFDLPLYSYDPEEKDSEVPESSPNQETLKEFIYAYSPDRDKSSQDVDDGIRLQFMHPFAALYFDLGISYRMTLESMTIKGLGYKGRYEFKDGVWTLKPGDVTDDLYISVQEDVPSEDLNFNSSIGGPYLVMPQATTGLQLSIKGSRLDGSVYDETVNLNVSGVTKWEAGKKYRYTLNLGQADAEILFKVAVEEWGVVSHKNNINVE